MIRLTVNGRTYEGAVSVSIDRGFVTLEHTFQIAYVDRWQPKAEPWPILPGDSAEVYWDDTLLVTGYINVADWSIDAPATYTLTAAGRSKTSDLGDCSAVHATGQWRQKTMVQIVKELCEPFDIEIEVDPVSSDKFTLFRIEPGETVYSAIERMARIRGYLITSDAKSKLRIVQASAVTRSFTLDPAGAFSRSLTADDQDRFSEYRITSQTAASDKFNKKQVAAQRFSVEDSGIDRYRPMVIVGNGPGHRKEIEASARYERNVRIGRGLIVRYSFPGVLDPTGVPWEPGAIVTVQDPGLRLNRTMVIDRMSFTGDARDLSTTIELVRPETYSVLDFVPKDRNART